MTHLGELDLDSFDSGAKEILSGCLGNHADLRAMALAAQIRSLIRAIRADGLDPRWQPERDALIGILVRDGHGINQYQMQITNKAAENIVRDLHERGYKIVKDEA